MIPKIFVHISGGCYQDSHNLPEGYAIEVIDWDNLLSEGDTAQEWNRFDAETKQFIRENYPEEFKLIQGHI